MEQAKNVGQKLIDSALGELKAGRDLRPGGLEMLTAVHGG
jgi:hypothetical protein